LYIAFGVNIGNLGRVGGRRKEMGEWTQEINRKLETLESSTSIVGWYGHTGNFVVESSRTEPSEFITELASAAGVSCAVVPYSDVVEYASVVERAVSPRPLVGKRWTPGIAFAVKAPPSKSVPKQTSHANFFEISEHAVGAWKMDTLTETEILDRERRGGGWGGVSGDVSRQLGGTWTARSLRTITGTLEKARRHLAAKSQKDV
jgi:hypothetical protein